MTTTFGFLSKQAFRERRAALLATAFAAAVSAGHAHGALTVESLQQLEVLAVAAEPGVLARRARAAAMFEQSVAAAQLPDPELMLGAMSLPIDSFSLDQEPMTQLQLGLSQRFPAGDSRQLAGAIMRGQGEAMSQSARVRELQVLRSLRRDWIEWLYWKGAEQITAQRGQLLTQMLGAVEARYDVGQGDQRELLLAEIAIARNRERGEMIRSQLEQQWAGLERWAGQALVPGEGLGQPQWNLREVTAGADVESLSMRLLQHPQVTALDHGIAARQRGIELAREAYRPSWSVNLSYGYRDGEELDGSARDDFFSAVVSMDLPLFTDKRQDRSLKASVYEHEASVAERLELLRSMRAMLEASCAAAARRSERLAIYRDELLPRSRDRVQSVRRAYQAADADFDDVIDALEEDLDLRLEEQRVMSDYLRDLADLKFLLESGNAAGVEDSTHE